MQTVEPAVATTRHPLDPLTADEIQAASSILKKERGLNSGHRFVYVMTDATPSVVEFWRDNPRLHALVEAGVLDFASFDVVE